MSRSSAALIVGISAALLLAAAPAPSEAAVDATGGFDAYAAVSPASAARTRRTNSLGIGDDAINASIRECEREEVDCRAPEEYDPDSYAAQQAASARLRRDERTVQLQAATAEGRLQKASMSTAEQNPVVPTGGERHEVAVRRTAPTAAVALQQVIKGAGDSLASGAVGEIDGEKHMIGGAFTGDGGVRRTYQAAPSNCTALNCNKIRVADVDSTVVPN